MGDARRVREHTHTRLLFVQVMNFVIRVRKGATQVKEVSTTVLKLPAADLCHAYLLGWQSETELERMQRALATFDTSARAPRSEGAADQLPKGSGILSDARRHGGHSAIFTHTHTLRSSV